MRKDENLLEISNKINKLLMDENLNYLEAFAILETVKGHLFAKLTVANMKTEVLTMRLKE